MSFGIPVRNGLMLGLTASTALSAGRGLPIPALSLNFLSGTLDSRITFTRALNTATRVNSSGLIETVNANIPRFDYDPVTLQPRGLLIEEARTNLLLNSLITGANLSTQNVTVTAVAHTISFYGTGSITLSGAHSATVNGTGAYPTRTTLTFTPTAGTLTCTVSGTVQFANLEVGSFATSYIPTGASTVTRNADVAAMTGTNFSSWYNATQGTFVVESAPYSAGNFTTASATDGGTNNRIQVTSSNTIQFLVGVGGVIQALLDAGTINGGAVNRVAGAYRVNDFAASTNGSAAVTDASGTLPTVTRLDIGNLAGFAEFLNGYVRAITYFNTRQPNDRLQALTR